MDNETKPNTVIPLETEEGLENEIEDAVGEGNENLSEELETDVYTLLSSNEDPEKNAAFAEYIQLEKNIKLQNETLANIKSKIQDMQSKSGVRNSENSNLKNLCALYEKEMLKLQDLLKKAINLQNTGSRRHYREFPVATTLDEDRLNLTNNNPYENLHTIVHKSPEISEYLRASAGGTSEMNTSSSCKGSQISSSEARKLYKIFNVFRKNECLKECKQHKNCKEKACMQKVKSKIKCMQQEIGKLNELLNEKEISSSKSMHKIYATPTCNKMEKANNFQQLKDNYLYLLTEFNKKDEQFKELTKRLKTSCSKCVNGCGQGDFASADKSELHLLRNRINDMTEEQIEFKCLMKEQSLQLEDYRNKYLMAQQNVEEQNVLIEKLNMNNKCIEKQINQEIKEIRAKFQERLTDLLKFPKLLENEQIKVSRVCKEKEELENKLLILCKELKSLKSKLVNNNVEDCKPQLNKCQQELKMFKRKVEEIQQQRDMFCEQLKATTEDLNALRSESAKIVARTKERAEFIKQQQQDQIDRLEKQLVQCRAMASLSVSDRENVIKEMQGQLNTLSYSFDAAQKQIKTLRNHIAFMSNENSYPTKL